MKVKTTAGRAVGGSRLMDTEGYAGSGEMSGEFTAQKMHRTVRKLFNNTERLPTLEEAVA